MSAARSSYVRTGSRRRSKPGPSGNRSGRASRPKKWARIHVRFLRCPGSRLRSYSGTWGRSPAATAPRHVRGPETRAQSSGRRSAAGPRRGCPGTARDSRDSPARYVRRPEAQCWSWGRLSRSDAAGKRGVRETLAPDKQADRLRRPSDMERAIDRYARAYDAAERNHREGLLS